MHPVDQMATVLGWTDKGPSQMTAKLANNTYAVVVTTDPITIGVRLHTTFVVLYYQHDDGTWSMKLQTGGFYTKTTQERINAWLPSGYRVHGPTTNISRKAPVQWHLGHGGDIRPFHDGIELTVDAPDLLSKVTQ